MFVIPSFAGGGAERVALTYLASLVRGNVACTLVVLDGKGPLARFVPEHIQVVDLKTPRLRHAILRLVREVWAQRPCVIFSTLGYVNLAVLALRPLLPKNSRIVVREANMPSISLLNATYPKLMTAASRLYYPKADRVLCTSSAMMRELGNIFKVEADQLHMAPNPVDESFIRLTASPPYSPPQGGVHFVAAGRLTHQKGFDRLIDIMFELPEETILSILGDGPDRNMLSKRATNHGIAHRVHFAGFQDNPWTWYAGADAFIMPSRWEGMPNAALEALACGAPVVATPESGGITDIANAAPDGAVTVVDAGKPMLEVLQAFIPVEEKTFAMRPSLLPAQYQREAACAVFSELLAGLN